MPPRTVNLTAIPFLGSEIKVASLMSETFKSSDATRAPDPAT